jgi:hypothetical protein
MLWTRIANVPHRNAGLGVALFDLQKPIGRSQVGSGANTHVFRADLLEEQKLLIGWLGRGLRAELDARLVGVNRGCTPTGGSEVCRRSQSAERQFAKLSPAGAVTV